MPTATKTPIKPAAKSSSAPKRTTTKLQPLADRLVVRPNEGDSMTSGGIFLPDTAKEKPQEGTVLAAGPGRLNEKGDRVKPEVKSGDTVLYARYAGSEVKVDGEELLIIKESDVLAVVG